MLRLCILIVAAIVTAKGQTTLDRGLSETGGATVHSVEFLRDSLERAVK